MRLHDCSWPTAPARSQRVDCGADGQGEVLAEYNPKGRRVADTDDGDLRARPSKRFNMSRDEGSESRLPSIRVEVRDDKDSQQWLASDVAERSKARQAKIRREKPPSSLRCSGMSPSDAALSPLRVAAERLFPHASIGGLTTFAPAGEGELVALLGSAPGILVAINAEKIAQADPTIAEITAAHVGYPDGLGAVLSMRRKGVPASRMPGSDLWLAIVDRYAADRSFFLVGSTQEVVTTVAERLRAQHPGIQLWYRNGFLSTVEELQLERDVVERRPHFVFVAMGSPRQEVLMRRLFSLHPAVYVGLGGSFDVYAGKQRRAPRWIRRVGLEWAYRLVSQPSRLRRIPRFLRFIGFLASGRL
jgi:UDP-N-acetyl-D-mannosaminouronate:lipid I N-acetyl-D-mannosaminouronosyltransferase